MSARLLWARGGDDSAALCDRPVSMARCLRNISDLFHSVPLRPVSPILSRILGTAYLHPSRSVPFGLPRLLAILLAAESAAGQSNRTF
jgi:hypothetical protein